MIINYVSFLHPQHFNGGGEQVMRSLLEWGKTYEQHKFHFTTVKPRLRDFNPKADLTIVTDFFNDPLSWRARDKALLNDIIQSGNFVHFDNAYVDSCNMGYLPCNGTHNGTCPFKTDLSFVDRLKMRDFGNACFQQNDQVRELYHRSKMNFFVSPRHQQKIESMLEVKAKSFVVKPIIDCGIFKNLGLERDIKNLFVGVISEAKGAKALELMFKDRPHELTIIGKNDTGRPITFGNYLGFIPQKELPQYYNRAQNFVYLPRWPEPQGRVVVEAALCGCNLITNENVGATSFNFDISKAENLKNAEQEFWNQIKEIA